MVTEIGEVLPDAEVDVDVVKITTKMGAEAAEWKIHDVFGFELLVEHEHGAHIAEEGLHEELVAWEDATAAIDLGFL